MATVEQFLNMNEVEIVALLESKKLSILEIFNLGKQVGIIEGQDNIRKLYGEFFNS